VGEARFNRGLRDGFRIEDGSQRPTHRKRVDGGPDARTMGAMRRLPFLLAFLVPLASAAPQDGAGERATLVIVAPLEWCPDLEPFVAARSQEFRVELAPLETTLANAPGADAPERLKRHLY